MSFHSAGSRACLPDRLYVYECRGDGLPQQEPIHPDFLGIWSERPCYYLFFSRPVPVFVAEWIRGQPGWTLESSYDLDYAQWQQVPQSDQRVGPFVISMGGALEERSSGKAQANQSEWVLALDPGVVFGSGLHPTSRGALLAIAHRLASGQVRTAVDFGTGTGILALAAAVGGAGRVLAIDCNPMAVQAALRNAARNRLEDRIVGVAADSLHVIRFPQDLLLMNIEWPSLAQVLDQGAWSIHATLVVSGFLRHLESEVIDRFTKPGLHRPTWRHEEDGWPTILFSSREDHRKG